MEYQNLTRTDKLVIHNNFVSGKTIEQLQKEYELPEDIVYQILFETDTFDKLRVYVPYYKNRSMMWKCAVAGFYMIPHSRMTTAKYFHVAPEQVSRVIKELGLPIRSHAEELKITHIEKFGSEETYRDHIVQKIRKTSFERYGVSNFAKTEEFRVKSKATCMERYGTANPMQCDIVKSTLTTRCMEKHGVAWPCMLPQARLMHGSDSKPNLQFYDALLMCFDPCDVSREYNIEGKSYDFKVGNRLIEVDPISTHNSSVGVFSCPAVPPDYHKKKTDIAVANGMSCIHVWEWDNTTRIVQRLASRKVLKLNVCKLHCIEQLDAEKFYSMNSIFPLDSHSTINIALLNNDQIVSCMSFHKENDCYCLDNFCSVYLIPGCAEKLFGSFVKEYSPTKVITFCDLSKFTNSLYLKLGFKSIRVHDQVMNIDIKTGKFVPESQLDYNKHVTIFGCGIEELQWEK